jgi:ketosteroid isomerase-like protein
MCLGMPPLRPWKNQMNKITLLALVLFVATASLVISSSATKANAETDADTLFRLEANFAADVAKHGHDAFLTYFADDGVEVVDGGGFDTKNLMRKRAPWPAGATLTWTPIKADMSASGDLGYTYGNYIFTAKNKGGKVVVNHGKYTSIWKKQKDGQWKVVVDMGNSSPDPKSGK